MSDIITAQHIVKKFHDLTAVNDISFSVKAGTIFAFLGTNGAGKSTTINMLTTALKPTSGSVTIDGHMLGSDDDAIRKKIGVVFQQSILDPLLTVQENIAVRASFYGLTDAAERIGELSELLDLGDFLNRRYGTLSGGQKRRADIARALIHEPAILFLDEPTAGLDPKSREDVWRAIYDLKKTSNLTVFLTTHYLEETERADDVYIINKGEIVASGTPQSLRSRYTSHVLIIEPKDIKAFAAKLATSKIKHGTNQGLISIKTDTSAAALKLLGKFEADIADFEFRHGTMDDVFLSLTGQEGQR